MTNSFFGHGIESIEYNELDQDQLTDLLKMYNDIVKEKLSVEEAVEAEESAEELIPGNISEENA